MLVILPFTLLFLSLKQLDQMEAQRKRQTACLTESERRAEASIRRVREAMLDKDAFVAAKKVRKKQKRHRVEKKPTLQANPLARIVDLALNSHSKRMNVSSTLGSTATSNKKRSSVESETTKREKATLVLSKWLYGIIVERRAYEDSDSESSTESVSFEEKQKAALVLERVLRSNGNLVFASQFVKVCCLFTCLSFLSCDVLFLDDASIQKEHSPDPKVHSGLDYLSQSEDRCSCGPSYKRKCS